MIQKLKPGTVTPYIRDGSKRPNFERFFIYSTIFAIFYLKRLYLQNITNTALGQTHTLINRKISEPYIIKNQIIKYYLIETSQVFETCEV